MGEIKNYTFSYQEIVEALIKKENIQEGIWGIYIEFGLNAANIMPAPVSKDVIPAAIIPVLKIGIQQFQEENNLTVDASKVNPAKGKRGK
jgi:hypothetical protein